MSDTDALPSIDELLKVAKEIVASASPIPMQHFRNAMNIDYKTDESPVTIADQNTEHAMRDCITKAFPEHGIFGEEHGKENLDHDVTWVLDPIDGTKSFISGSPMFGMLISVLIKQVPTLGIIHMPALNETFIGIRGQSATHDDKPIKVSACTDLANAICYVGEGDKMLNQRPDIFPKLQKHTRLARFGFDCYPYGQLSMGAVDMVIERGLMPYDFLAVIPVIEGAGGIITDWSGAPVTMESPGDVLACATPELHKQALDLINS